jgi:FtsH-binding integral membrane protein
MQYDSSMQEMTYAGSARMTFIKKTYAHLAGAILAFVALETVLLQTINEKQIMAVFGGSSWSILIVMLAFWGASYVAQMLAQSDSSAALQYVGLGLYVVAEGLIFLPILYVAKNYMSDPNLIPAAGALTLCVFAGLTISVFATGKDYSFFGPCTFSGQYVDFWLDHLFHDLWFFIGSYFFICDGGFHECLYPL